MSFTRTKRFLSCLMLVYFFTGVFAARAETVDLLMIYDDYTETRFNGSPRTALENWVDQANSFYRASQVDIELRLVAALNHTVSGSNMDDVLNRTRTDTWVNEQRDLYGADFVTNVHKTGDCGIGFLGVSPRYAFNVVGSDCGSGVVLAHELGHNMGLMHSRAQGDRAGSLYPYGLGHGEQNLFGTLMTYYWIYGGRSANVFSNPNLNCYGKPCGIPAGQNGEADAARALNNVKAEISKFRASVTDGSSSTSSSSTSSTSSSSGSTSSGSTSSTSTSSGSTSSTSTSSGGTSSTSTSSGGTSSGSTSSTSTSSGSTSSTSTSSGSTSTSSSSTSSGGVCVDRNQYCSFWAGIGECSANPGYMLTNCAKSCGSCPSSSTSSTSSSSSSSSGAASCNDINYRCRYWARRGECSVNPGYMLNYCAKSCNSCN